VSETAEGRGYADPVVTGVALGVVLFGAIMLAGRGIGASGAFASGAAAAVNAVAPGHAAAHPYLSRWIPTEKGGLAGVWIVLELLAVALGAWLSARLSGRVRKGVDVVGAKSARGRMVNAAIGGVLMGGGARLAHGCTSGLGLTGGALLATGAWVFIPVAFATAFLVSYLMRRGAT
jgi:uncharacterized membrane protein YedE/YeeE